MKGAKARVTLVNQNHIDGPSYALSDNSFNGAEYTKLFGGLGKRDTGPYQTPYLATLDCQRSEGEKASPMMRLLHVGPCVYVHRWCFHFPVVTFFPSPEPVGSRVFSSFRKGRSRLSSPKARSRALAGPPLHVGCGRVLGSGIALGDWGAHGASMMKAL